MLTTYKQGTTLSRALLYMHVLKRISNMHRLEHIHKQIECHLLTALEAQ